MLFELEYFHLLNWKFSIIIIIIIIIIINSQDSAVCITTRLCAGDWEILVRFPVGTKSFLFFKTSKLMFGPNQTSYSTGSEDPFYKGKAPGGSTLTA
jgi:hypothetical protein